MLGTEELALVKNKNDFHLQISVGVPTKFAFYWFDRFCFWIRYNILVHGICCSPDCHIVLSDRRPLFFSRRGRLESYCLASHFDRFADPRVPFTL
jgi:hypothetical protein